MACVDTTLYDVLNISTRATDKEIKTAYRKLAKEFHPDKNPNSGDKFKEISYAHEVLTDPQRRSVYDQLGLDGLQNKGHRSDSSPSFHDDILSHLFGMGRRRRRTENSVFPLKVTLEELYNGSSNKFMIERNIVCIKCKGNGTKSGIRHMCRECHGSGMRVQFSQMLFLMQQQVPCTTCRGQGAIIPDNDRCNQCRGKKMFDEKKKFEVFVEKGMEDNERIKFQGQGNQTPGTEAGDVVVILQEMPHDQFKRVGDDLFVEKEISLTEALCGFSFGLQHLDGRVLRVMQPGGACIKTGQIRGIESEGMPQRRSDQKGNLYIKFKVDFPQNYFANEAQLQLLENLLGPRPEFTMPTGEFTEEVDLQEYVPTKENANARYGEAYCEDEEEGDFYFAGSPFGDAGRGVQCAQQ